jgi:hypothetical protein
MPQRLPLTSISDDELFVPSFTTPDSFQPYDIYQAIDVVDSDQDPHTESRSTPKSTTNSTQFSQVRPRSEHAWVHETNMRQAQWAKPHKLKRSRLLLKRPRGISATSSTNTSNWANIIDKLYNVYTYERIQPDQTRLLVLKSGAFKDHICVSLITVEDA